MKLACHPRPISAKHLITTPDHLPPHLLPNPTGPGPERTTAHCIAVLSSFPVLLRRKADAEETEEREEDDTAVVLFPPEGERGLVRGLLMGEGTGSCPAGQCKLVGLIPGLFADDAVVILYLSSTVTDADAVDPKTVLRPYLERLSQEPLFEAYYLSHDTQSPPTAPSSSESPQYAAGRVVVVESYSQGESITEGLDWEAEQGEKAFWAVMGDKDKLEAGVKGWWEKDGEVEEGEGEEEVELQGL